MNRFLKKFVDEGWYWYIIFFVIISIIFCWLDVMRYGTL
jgi:hypothetical protein